MDAPQIPLVVHLQYSQTSNEGTEKQRPKARGLLRSNSFTAVQVSNDHKKLWQQEERRKRRRREMNRVAAQRCRDKKSKQTETLQTEIEELKSVVDQLKSSNADLMRKVDRLTEEKQELSEALAKTFDTYFQRS